MLKLVRVLPCVLCERAWAFRKPSAKPVLKASWCASGMLLLFRRLSKVSGTWPLSRISKPCRDKTRVNCRPAPSRFTTFSRLHVDQTFIKDGVNESVSGGCSKPPWRRLVLDFRVLKPRLWINTERDRETERDHYGGGETNPGEKHNGGGFTVSAGVRVRYLARRLDQRTRSEEGKSSVCKTPVTPRPSWRLKNLDERKNPQCSHQDVYRNLQNSEMFTLRSRSHARSTYAANLHNPFRMTRDWHFFSTYLQLDLAHCREEKLITVVIVVSYTTSC